jgi:hypothetical protein
LEWAPTHHKFKSFTQAEKTDPHYLPLWKGKKTQILKPEVAVRLLSILYAFGGGLPCDVHVDLENPRFEGIFWFCSTRKQGLSELLMTGRLKKHCGILPSLGKAPELILPSKFGFADWHASALE